MLSNRQSLYKRVVGPALLGLNLTLFFDKPIPLLPFFVALSAAADKANFLLFVIKTLNHSQKPVVQNNEILNFIVQIVSQYAPPAPTQPFPSFLGQPVLVFFIS